MQQQVRICADCRFLAVRREGRPAKCLRDEAAIGLSLVTGEFERRTANEMRGNKGACGPGAKLFETWPRPVRDRMVAARMALGFYGERMARLAAMPLTAARNGSKVWLLGLAATARATRAAWDAARAPQAYSVGDKSPALVNMGVIVLREEAPQAELPIEPAPKKAEPDEVGRIATVALAALVSGFLMAQVLAWQPPGGEQVNAAGMVQKR